MCIVQKCHLASWAGAFLITDSYNNVELVE
jgi:hypothetical protein